MSLSLSHEVTKSRSCSTQNGARGAFPKHMSGRNHVSCMLTSCSLGADAMQVGWLNKSLSRMWPHINKAASKLLEETLTPYLEMYKPVVLEGMKIKKLTLGDVAPLITGMASQPALPVLQNDCWDAHPSYSDLIELVTILGLWEVRFKPDKRGGFVLELLADRIW